jgi:tRNA-Thr(GGU) m(6)t(6)A37 methyltransferase TsaA
MAEITPFQTIAHIHSDFTAKFGIPRQSGLVESTHATIVFEPEFRNPDALRGLDGYSHLWLLWQFSECVGKPWTPTVRPPRLGGNTRMGVFATRSPFRPNPIGLSSVKIVKIEPSTPKGPVIHVAGADLLDGTPIYDIKPYLPFSDSRPDAAFGYAEAELSHHLSLGGGEEKLSHLSDGQRAAVLACLAEDPRPSYQEDAARVYHMRLGTLEAAFTVEGDLLTVIGIEAAE